jgi:hypothetical protein
MAERDDARYGNEQPIYPHDPHDPPEAVANRRVRRAALWTYLGPIVIIALVLGIAMLFWTGHQPWHARNDRTPNSIGTTGTEPKDENLANYPQSGGGDPARRPSSTADELKQKGAGR